MDFPLMLDMREPIRGDALAAKLEIPREEIEVMIVNGTTESLSHSIQPGDRVAFVPWGTPGPYRIFLGFIYKNKRWPALYYSKRVRAIPADRV